MDKFLKHWFKKPGILIEKLGFAEKNLFFAIDIQILHRKTSFFEINLVYLSLS